MIELQRKKYDELRAKLQIDILRIGDELIAMPALVQETAELAAVIGAEEHGCRLALDIISAEAASRLREPEDGKKAKSETQIASELISQGDVQDARQAYDSAKLDAAQANALHNSMREKVRLLGKACDLVVAGFITPSSYSPRRADLINRAADRKSG